MKRLLPWMLGLAALAGCDAGAAVAPEADAIPGDDCKVRNYPTAFQVTAMRSAVPGSGVDGNTFGALEAAMAAGVRHVEVDFHLSRDNVLVSSHNPVLEGCGVVARKDAAELLSCDAGGSRLATLDELLDMGFESILVDLKDSDGKNDARLEAAARTAIEGIRQRERRSDAVLMLYRKTPGVVRALEGSGVRTALKGYPKSGAEVEAFIDRAAAEGFEFICVQANRISPSQIASAADRGMWFLAWDYVRKHNVSHWQELAEAGLGGLIVADPQLAVSEAAPRFRPVCSKD